MIYRVALFLLPLAACSSGANHLGNPLLLPASGLSTALDNAAYGASRKPVESYVGANFDDLVADIEAGGGADLTTAFTLAGVAPAKRADFLAAMQDYDLSRPDNLVAALMVFGQS